MLPQAAKLGGIALDFLFPKWCLGCGAEGEFICPACHRSLPIIPPPVCPRCGRPQSSGVVCPACVTWQASIDGIRSPFKFDGAIRRSVHALKYQGTRALAGPLAAMLHEYYRGNPIPGDILVPVPLHIKRLRERGYSQAGLLAGRLGKLLGMPQIDNCLVRTRHSQPQARSARVEERRQNVAGAFACRDGRLAGRQVILIDDVCTSGSTLHACAAAAKAGGAISVWGLTLAREI